MAVLTSAAAIYGWRLDPLGDDAVRVVRDTCTRQPESRRVLERARLMDADAVAGVRAERSPARV